MSRAEPRRALERLLAALAMLLALGAMPKPSSAEAIDPERADQVKAAYLINFLRYTDWPAASVPTRDSPFRVLVAGRPELIDTVRRLAAAAGSIGGREVVVDRMALPQPGGILGSELRAQIATQVRRCHLLFVEREEANLATDLIALVRDYPVLTVGDVDSFAEAGGMLALLPRGTNIVLAANPGAIRRSDLVVSAKVLKIARLVADAEPPR